MIVEVCVDTVAGLAAALHGGADRIELCAALVVGGLTPSAGFMRHAADAGVPVMAMIRPRAGGFCYSPAEIDLMLADIAMVRDIGLAGVVLGASLCDGQLDVAALSRLVAAAEGMALTLHRAFDLVPDWEAALETAIALGFERVLTSGGALTAAAGIDRLVAMQARAAGRILILPGAGITAETVTALAAMRPAEVHGSCSVPCAATGRATEFGFGPAVERVTDAGAVRSLRAALGRMR